VNSEERQSILEICEHFTNIFYMEWDRLTLTNLTEHIIKLLKDQPTNQQGH